MNKDEIIQSIIDQRTYKQMMLSTQKHPELHQFVTTGLQMGQNKLEKYIGYCVQIRKNCGQFGSDMVFLRHADGSLTTHENQCFYSMTEEQEALARTVFECLPEEEEPELGYKCCQKIHEVGFLIEKSETQPSPNTPFSITVTKGDGSIEKSVFL
jgi:hypothetical protein